MQEQEDMHTYTHGHTHSQSHFLLCWIPMTTEQAESMLNIPAWCVHHGPIMIQLGQFSSEDQPIIDLHLFSDPQFSLSLSLSLSVCPEPGLADYSFPFKWVAAVLAPGLHYPDCTLLEQAVSHVSSVPTGCVQSARRQVRV